MKIICRGRARDAIFRSMILRHASYIVAAAAALAIAGSQDAHDTAYVFAYRMAPGKEADFEAGYRRHLQWHANHRDSLRWLGWTVIEGPGTGMFVDGTFGTSPAMFAARPMPDSDVVDARSSFLPFAQPAYRETWLLRRDLSNGTALEEARTRPFQLVVTMVAGPSSTLEGVLSGARGRGGRWGYAIYQRAGDTDSRVYRLVVQIDRQADGAAARRDLVDALLQAAAIRPESTEAELWRYRPELSRIPR